MPSCQVRRSARCSRPRSWSRCWPGRPLAWSTTEPRSLPSRTGSPSARPSCGHGVGMEQRGRALLALERGRHLGEGRVQELARGCGDQPEGLGRASARRRPACGRGASASGAPCGPRLAQSGLKRKRPSGVGKPSRWCALRNRARCSSRRRRATVSASGQPERCEQIVDQLPLGHGEAGMLGAEALRELADDIVVGPALGVTARGPACGPGSSGARRPGRCRRARGTWSPGGRCRPARAVSVMNCSCTATNRSSRAKPRCTLPRSGAMHIGLVFWISRRVNGGPPPAGPAVAGQDRADLRLVELRGRCDRGRPGPRSVVLSQW